MGLALLEGKDLLEGKKIIVTGGAGGIGSATVDEFVRQGATVTSVDVKDEEGLKYAEEANAHGPGSCTYVHCNIEQEKEVEEAFAQAKEDMGDSTSSYIVQPSCRRCAPQSNIGARISTTYSTTTCGEPFLSIR